MKKPLLIIILSLLLVSCGSSSSSSSFDFNKGFVYQNGDIISSLESYGSICRNPTSDDVINTIESGMQAFVFLYGNTCSHCETFFPTFKGALNNSKIECYAFESASSIVELYKVVTHFSAGNYSIVFSDLYTPSMFYLESPLTAEKLNLNSIKSAASLDSLIKQKANISNVTTFETYGGFTRFLAEKDAFCYIIDDKDSQSISFYDRNVLRYAKTSYFNTCLIRWNRLSDTDKNLFTQTLKLENNDHEVCFSFKKGDHDFNKISYITDSDEAITAALNYYQILL